ncbi:hypothetical protein WN48_06219 [Eufriesea mexicana]|uniref:Uncharacterized protein n=1 Tax=Eufriesea mexicana TaxID=516756 RepID=A0A310S420_9HYME|nr:hypothetical protein WN48_06219 [Eufriesea mexicana]
MLPFCAETLPDIECSSNTIVFINNTFEDCTDFEYVKYLEHDIHLLTYVEQIENITFLYRFSVCVTAFRNFSPVTQYKKKLIAKFQ